MNWKLILCVVMGVVLSIAVTRLAFHKPVVLEVAIAGLLSILAGVLLSVLLSMRRTSKPSMR